MTKGRIYGLLMVLMLCIGTTVAFAASAADGVSDGEILYITSYNADTRFSNEFLMQTMSEYEAKGGKLKMEVEAMNCSSFDTRNEWMERMQSIMERHPKARLVMLYGPEARACYLSLPDQRYHSLPLITVSSQEWGATVDDAYGINAIQKTEGGDSLMAFNDIQRSFNSRAIYYYEYGIENDLNALHDLFPKTKNFAVVTDNSYAGVSMRNHIRKVLLQRYDEKNVFMIDGTQLNTSEALNQVESLPENTAIIFCIWRYDKTGAIQTFNGQQKFREICEHRMFPTISLTGTGFNPWAIGGSHPNYDWNDGRRKPSDIIYHLIDLGENIEPYIFKAPNIFYMDANALKFFNIDTNNLPHNVVIINDNTVTIKDLWHIYKYQFIIGGLIFVSLIIMLIGTILYTMRMRKMKKALEQNNVELNKARKKAVESDEMKTHFIQNMSHEVRTPLNAIVGFSDLLASGVSLPEEDILTISHQIRSNSQQLTMIINDILSISNMETGGYKINLRPANVQQLCLMAGSATEHRLPAGVELKYDLMVDENFEFVTDEQRVQQLLVNMLTNSCKNTTEGSITLRCEEKSDGVLFCVTDTGCGVPKGEEERIFERFVKLNEFKPGAGLGLNICRTIAEKLNGSIWCDKSHEGPGARFCLFIPKK